MMRRAARWISPPCVLAALLIGCSLATSYEGFSGVVPRRPPRLREGVQGGRGPIRVAAATSLRFLQITKDDPPIGYDLDNWCTNCPDGALSCKNPNPTTSRCDNGGTCIDNQVQFYADKLQGSVGGGSAGTAQQLGTAFQESLDTGEHGILIEIGDWDGLPDDDDVTFSILNVTGVNEGTRYQPGALNEYSVDADALLAGGVLPREIARGYVANNTVVVRGFSFDFLMRLKIPNAEFGPQPLTVEANFRNALFVGTFAEQGDGTFAMTDAQLGGALSIEQVQKQLFRFTLCPTGPTDEFSLACGLRDLSAASPLDPEAPCDSMSFAFGMNLAAAKRTGAVPLTRIDLRASGNCAPVPPGCP